jgi:hypothetical protein
MLVGRDHELPHAPSPTGCDHGQTRVGGAGSPAGARRRIVGGDADQSPLSTRGPDWWTDAYRLSPAGKHMLTLFGADHSLGGVHAYGTVPMTAAENPALLALVQQLSAAYLRTALGVDEASFPAARDTLAGQAGAAGRLEPS